MTTRTASVALFLILSLQRNASLNAFIPLNQQTRPPSRRTILLRSSPASDPDPPVNGSSQGKDDSPTSSSSSTTSPKRRPRRAADYPSFSYTEEDPRVTAYQQKMVKMKYKGCGLENVEFDKPPPVVVVPDRGNSEDGQDSSIVSELALMVTGGYESGLGEIGISALKTRLLKGRSYAKKEPFSPSNLNTPPSLSDLSYPPSSFWKGFWVGAPARFATGLTAYFAFPYLTTFVENFVTIPPQQLEAITSKFGPGISILYGTFISLTLSILYNRVKDIQDAAARESAMLTLVTRSLLKICQDDKESAIEAAQCCADQIRTLVKSSRGRELLVVIYSDPYARMLELLDYEEECLYKIHGGLAQYGNLLGNCRDSITDLIRMRSERLSMEALSLPPTHFLVLNLLTLLILLSYMIAFLPSMDPATGNPPNESSILFAILTNVYILFYFFAKDLNNPFDGVYQIRRSSSAVHLLEAKWLIANHPLTQGEVDFEEVIDEDAQQGGVAKIVSPGLGEMVFETEDLFVDGIGQPTEEEEKGLD